MGLLIAFFLLTPLSSVSFAGDTPTAENPLKLSFSVAIQPNLESSVGVVFLQALRLVLLHQPEGIRFERPQGPQSPQDFIMVTDSVDPLLIDDHLPNYISNFVDNTNPHSVFYFDTPEMPAVIRIHWDRLVMRGTGDTSVFFSELLVLLAYEIYGNLVFIKKQSQLHSRFPGARIKKSKFNQELFALQATVDFIDRLLANGRETAPKRFSDDLNAARKKTMDLLTGYKKANLNYLDFCDEALRGEWDLKVLRYGNENLVSVIKHE